MRDGVLRPTKMYHKKSITSDNQIMKGFTEKKINVGIIRKLIRKDDKNKYERLSTKKNHEI